MKGFKDNEEEGEKSARVSPEDSFRSPRDLARNDIVIEVYGDGEFARGDGEFARGDGE